MRENYAHRVREIEAKGLVFAPQRLRHHEIGLLKFREAITTVPDAIHQRVNDLDGRREAQIAVHEMVEFREDERRDRESLPLHDSHRPRVFRLIGVKGREQGRRVRDDDQRRAV
jgi:hypothetical protein